MESGTNGGAPSCVKPFPASRFSVMSIYPSKRGTSSLIVPPDDTAASEKKSTRTGSARRKRRRSLWGIMKVKLDKTQFTISRQNTDSQNTNESTSVWFSVYCALCSLFGYWTLCFVSFYNNLQFVKHAL